MTLVQKASWASKESLQFMLGEATAVTMAPREAGATTGHQGFKAGRATSAILANLACPVGLGTSVKLDSRV